MQQEQPELQAPLEQPAPPVQQVQLEQQELLVLLEQQVQLVQPVSIQVRLV